MLKGGKVFQDALLTSENIRTDVESVCSKIGHDIKCEITTATVLAVHDHLNTHSYVTSKLKKSLGINRAKTNHTHLV